MTQQETPPPTTIPVVTPNNEVVTDHTIQHAEKIAELDGKLTRQEQDFYRRLEETQTELRKAIEEGGRGSEERIAKLEEKIDAMISAPPPVPIETPPPGVPFEVPDVDRSPIPPERMSRGIRARRVKRRAK